MNGGTVFAASGKPDLSLKSEFPRFWSVMMIARIAVVVVLFSPGLAVARDITAANCSQASVQSAVNSAVNGDRVLVPACSATWSSEVHVANKNIIVQGAGAGATVITGRAVNLTNAATRVTGFTFNLSNAAIYITDSRGFRYDHNTISEPGWQFCMQILGSSDNGDTRSLRPSEGLIDNNNMTNCRIVHFGATFANGGSDRWIEPLSLGSERNVYIEDNTYTVTNCPQGQNGVLCNFVDTNIGGRYVARFNTIINSYFEAHSAGGQTRGSRLVEIYNNHTTLQVAGNVNGLGGFYRPYFLRAGVGMVFHNTHIDNGTATGDVDNERSYSSGGSWGLCNGSQFVDSNELPNGYACRDQIGLGGDNSYWSAKGGAPASTQFKLPSYYWRNTRQGSAELAFNVANGAVQIVQNRDFYRYNSSFSGSTGVGEGPVSARPATCTVGVAYWATDQGEWNSRKAGPDGQLYRCTATNTWTLYYVPYAYPHPLQTSMGSVPPAAPQNVRILTSEH